MLDKNKASSTLKNELEKSAKAVEENKELYKSLFKGKFSKEDNRKIRVISIPFAIIAIISWVFKLPVGFYLGPAIIWAFIFLYYLIKRDVNIIQKIRGKK